MGGLQNKLMERSKSIMGNATIYIKSNEGVADFEDFLSRNQISFLKEYEIELLLRYQTYITPVIAHGIDTNGYLPSFLPKSEHKFESVIPTELAYKIGIAPPENLQLISPSHVDSFLGDIPRSQSISVNNIISTDVPEVDQAHLWVKLTSIQNLIQSKSINRIRIFGKYDFKKISAQLPKTMLLKTWEDENKTLVWALNLESTIMVFLFAVMSLLVSLCISSGLLIFFNKIKNDLASFWILGTSYKKISNTTKYFLNFTSIVSIISGIVFALLFLFLFDKFAPEIMPDVFVDRKIPIMISLKGLVISFVVPFGISSLFIYFSLTQFQKEHSPLDQVRSVS